MRNLCVVAHPDDESLWCSGYIIKNPGDWTIICCSIPRVDPIRAWKFFDACEVLGARGKLIPITEREPSEALVGMELIEVKGYDFVITHNLYGEYGHRHHQFVSNVVQQQCREYQIPGMTFGYRRDGLGEIKVELTEEEFHKKMQVLQCYNHVLPYAGRDLPKWAALIERYVDGEGLSLEVETYDYFGK